MEISSADGVGGFTPDQSSASSVEPDSYEALQVHGAEDDEHSSLIPTRPGLLQRMAGSPWATVLNNPYSVALITAGATWITNEMAQSSTGISVAQVIPLVVLGSMLVGSVALYHTDRNLTENHLQYWKNRAQTQESKRIVLKEEKQNLDEMVEGAFRGEKKLKKQYDSLKNQQENQILFTRTPPSVRRTDGSSSTETTSTDYSGDTSGEESFNDTNVDEVPPPPLAGVAKRRDDFGASPSQAARARTTASSTHSTHSKSSAFDQVTSDDELNFERIHWGGRGIHNVGTGKHERQGDVGTSNGATQRTDTN